MGSLLRPQLLLLCLLILPVLWPWAHGSTALDDSHAAVAETGDIGSTLSPANFSRGRRGDTRDHYLSNAELEVALKKLVAKCHNISRMYSIGESVLGAPLWVVEISNNPGVLEPKPSFKFVGNLHGNEPTGREILLSLAQWLCERYGKDPVATRIIDNVHLHLLPTMNPDGFGAKNRSNANNIDLNRDFPDQFLPQNNDPSTRQPETRAVMNWIRTNRFVASASLHEGALVANYPWDGSNDGKRKYSPCPDDQAFRHLATLYARAHASMTKKNQEFPTGITNGAAWYPLYGGMQDWNYIHGGCFELTIEVDSAQWPPFNQVARIAREHRRSMLELVTAVVNSGVHGKVISSTGVPLGATITVEGISHRIYASEAFGDFHRLLAPEQAYEVTASMWGYKSRTTSIFLNEGKPTYVDFILEPIVQYTSPAVRLRGQAAGEIGGQDGRHTSSQTVTRRSNDPDNRDSHLSNEVVGEEAGAGYSGATGLMPYSSGGNSSDMFVEKVADHTVASEARSVSQLTMESFGVSSLSALLACTIALVYILFRWRGFKLLRLRQLVRW